jgi:hypothetical protein
MKLHEAFNKLSDSSTLDEDASKMFSQILKHIAIKVGCDMNSDLFSESKQNYKSSRPRRHNRNRNNHFKKETQIQK